jgi:hypothetical protein
MSRFVPFVVGAVSALALSPLAGYLASEQVGPTTDRPDVAGSTVTKARTGNWCC